MQIKRRFFVPGNRTRINLRNEPRTGNRVPVVCERDSLPRRAGLALALALALSRKCERAAEQLRLFNHSLASDRIASHRIEAAAASKRIATRFNLVPFFLDPFLPFAFLHTYKYIRYTRNILRV